VARSINRRSVKEDKVAPIGISLFAQVVAGDKEAPWSRVWFAKEWKTSTHLHAGPTGLMWCCSSV
jgi:hypothetical protein